MSLLQINGLKTVFFTEGGVLPAVDNISFTIKPGEILGLVGESGCGKSVTALSILRLISPPGKITDGEILFEGSDLLKLSGKEMQNIRGRKISMIFQEPMTSLNPVLSVGNQIGETLIIHKGYKKKEARLAAIELLRAVKIPDAEKRVDQYPHQLSGGMRQRIMIAMAIACRPALLIADEPTTALDVTIQAQILDLLMSLGAEFGLSILLITHALGVVAEVADRVVVLYAGKIVEEAPVGELFQNPQHPYTVGLLDSIPRLVLAGEKAKRLKTIEGAVPDLGHLPPGCSFYDRCKLRMDICKTTFPSEIWLNPDHRVACYAVSNEQ
jgi:oligopeptide/dipeptide ABC transporter ATP-binding protein